MRIMFAAHQFFPEHYAGVEIVTLGLAKEFRARGHETFVFAPKRTIPGSGIEPGEVQDYEFEGVPVRRVGRPKEGLFRPYRMGYENEFMAQRAREYVRSIRPDIVHAEHFQGLSASVIPAFKATGAPLVYTATDFWTFCPVVDLVRHDGVMCEGPEVTHCFRCMISRQPNSLPGVLLKAATKRIPNPALKAAKGLADTPLSGVFPLSQVRALKERPGFIREEMEGVDHIIAYTHLMKDLLLANGVGEGRIGISPYGIDTSRITRVHRDPLPPLRVGFIGTLAPHKGCDILIRAMRSLESEATLEVYGNLKRFLSYVEHLQRLAEGDGRVSFAGPFQGEKVGEILSRLAVLFVSSRWYENQPAVMP